ncbi:hypothetical protein Csa_003749 [Cucumis sativus]|nr:hypothetical protein Csa_003749 [Cucumis sativus]
MYAVNSYEHSQNKTCFSRDAIDSRDANAIYLPNLTPFLAFLVACCTEYLTCGFRRQENAQVESFYIPKMEYLSDINSSWTYGHGCFTAAVRIDKLYLLIWFIYQRIDLYSMF